MLFRSIVGYTPFGRGSFPAANVLDRVAGKHAATVRQGTVVPVAIVVVTAVVIGAIAATVVTGAARADMGPGRKALPKSNSKS